MLQESLVFARIAAVFVSDHTLAACSDDGADVGESPGSGSGSGFGWARDRPPAWPVRISAAAQRTPQSSLPWTVTESQRMLCKGFNFQKGFAGAPGCSSRVWRLCPTNSSWLTSSPSSSGLPASGWRSTRCPSVGFFFVLPGAQDSDDWLGRSLLDA